MEPSSFIISEIAPTGVFPARRVRSTAASVWPRRTRTPPSRARSGTTWPGRLRSPAAVSGSPSTRMVRARSAAEMPVVTPVRASTETVKAVPLRSWLVWWAGGSSSRSAVAAGMATQM